MDYEDSEEYNKYCEKIKKINLKRNKLNEIIDIVISSSSLTTDTINCTHFNNMYILNDMCHAYDKYVKEEK